MAYLCNHYEPNSRTELIRMQQRVKAYKIIGEELYKTSVIGPLLHCLSKDEGKNLLTQTHAEVTSGQGPLIQRYSGMASTGHL
jgi:hypothetical protein